MHAGLHGRWINRLSRIDRVTGEPIRCYEHPYPGSLLHVDVTRFGNIPDARSPCRRRQQGAQNKRSTPGLSCGADRNSWTGTAYVRTVLDNHSGLAYIEI